jgi:hypothetical protein
MRLRPCARVQNLVPLWAKLIAGGIAGVVGTSLIL